MNFPRVFLLVFCLILFEYDHISAFGANGGQMVVERNAKTQGTKSRLQPWLQFNVSGHTASIRDIAFSSDGSRLYSAGDDKILKIWYKDSTSTNWSEMRSVRWPVGRSYWGNINALSVGSQRIVFGGYAASSFRKQIWTLDAKTGDFDSVTYPETPAYHIVGIVLLPGENKAVVTTIDGTVEIYENRNKIWNSVEIINPPDIQSSVFAKIRPEEREKSAQYLFRYRHPQTTALLADRYLVFPVLHGIDDDWQVIPIWRLACYDLQTERKAILPIDFYSSVCAVAAGKRHLAASDEWGGVYLWNFSRAFNFRKTPTTIIESEKDRNTKKRNDENSPKAKKPQPVPCLESLAFNREETHLFGGTAQNKEGIAFLHSWDVSEPSRNKRISFDEPILACAVAPQENTIAFTQKNDIHFASTETLKTHSILRSEIRPVSRVEFSRADYQFKFSYAPTASTAPGTAESGSTFSFDPATSSLSDMEKPFGNSQNENSPWQLRYALEWNKYWIGESHSDRYSMFLPLNPSEKPINSSKIMPEKGLDAVCWLNGSDGTKPRYLFVGISHPANEIIAFDLAKQDSKREVSIVRKFYGHQGPISSLSVSYDEKYLLSGSWDGTIRFWNIADLSSSDAVFQKWGLQAAPRNGQLVVERIAESCPLFIRGVKKGSIIKEIVRPTTTPGRIDSVSNASSMISSLEDDAFWDSALGFVIELTPGNVQRFTITPAHREMAAFFAVDQGNDFAFWTPSGYFTASANAPNYFGWLTNKGLRDYPDFAPAISFSELLENRPVMEHLLISGGLEKAFEEVDKKRLEELERKAKEAQDQQEKIVLQKLIDRTKKNPTRTKHDLLTLIRPSIKIESPRSPTELSFDAIQIEANVRFLETDEIDEPRMFVNGIKARRGALKESKRLSGGIKESKYVWNNVPLPSDPRVLVKAFVGSVPSEPQEVQRKSLKPPHRPTLYLFAIGCDYLHTRTGFQELSGVPAMLTTFEESVKKFSQRIYDVELTKLQNEKATLPEIQRTFRNFMVEKQGKIQPDDLFVFYLVGHGALDPNTGRYYYATYDTIPDEYKANKFDKSLGFNELLPLAELPCKRIVLLETCQVVDLRVLQDPMVDYRRLEEEHFILITAAEPGESAYWFGDEIGRFSRFLFRGWEGQADGFNPNLDRAMDGWMDGKVTINEIYDFVSTKLKDENRRSSDRQVPEIFGKDLLEKMDVPLSEHPKQLKEPGVRSIVEPRRLQITGR